MRRVVALCSLFVGMVATASAGDCVNGVCLTPNVQAVVTVPAISAAVSLPIYGAAYSPAGGGDDDTRALLRELIAEVKALRADISKGGGAPSANSAAAGPDPVAVLRTSCASCHTGEKAKGEFLLFTDKGELVKLSPADRREVSRRVQSGNMPPPPGRLAQGDRDAVLRGMK
jgi:hypothetical protein